MVTAIMRESNEFCNITLYQWTCISLRWVHLLAECHHIENLSSLHILLALFRLRGCMNRAHSVSWPEVVKGVPNVEDVDCSVSWGNIVSFSLVFLMYVVLCLIVFGCQYQCNWLPGKTHLQSDLFCVEWDVKSYTLTLTLLPVTKQCNLALMKLEWTPTRMCRSFFFKFPFPYLWIVIFLLTFKVQVNWGSKLGSGIQWSYVRSLEESMSVVLATLAGVWTIVHPNKSSQGAFLIWQV